ncbi:hypothetical protein KA183_20005, partial [bacterium]|nr:hypothetical protein [bacterium]
GQIECDKSVLEFRRDSEGYSFIDRKANREMTMYRDFQNPNNLEAWRIHRYLNSIFKDRRIEHEYIRRLMNALSAKTDSPIEKIGDRYFWNESKKEQPGLKFGDFKIKKKRT